MRRLGIGRVHIDPFFGFFGNITLSGDIPKGVLELIRLCYNLDKRPSRLVTRTLIINLYRIRN